MESAQISDTQAHTVLLAAARGLMANGADFTIAALLTETGVSHTQFRRCFAGKKKLLAALTEADARALGEILEVAQPVQIQRAVGSDVVPAPVAAPDAWLERRLRVFERALAGLEKRQEKSAQDIGRQLALLEEKLAAPAAPAGMAETVAAVFDPAESNLLPADRVSDPVSDPAPPDPVPAQPMSLAPAVLAHVEEIAASAGEPEPIGEKEIADFIAHARQVARNAMPVQPRKRRRGPVHEAILLSAILIGGIFVIGTTLLLASAGPRAMPIVSASISHRQSAQGPLARVVALADSGNADAQTALALAYMRATDRVSARRWSLAAASQGQPVAQYLLGTLYLEDQNNEGEAIRWLAAAAQQGNVKAMHNLAIAYAQGQGVPQDATLAVRWFARAAASGYRDSQFDLAVLYERGLGVPQSGAAALKWYLIAAGQGDGPSAARAAALKADMNPAEIRVATAEAAGFVPASVNRPANAVPYS